jgi:adenylate kinase family enzyme
LGEITGLPVIELDKIFWQPGLESMPRAHWVKTQQRLVEQELWTMDGDLGQYDAVEVRLSAADTIILLDFAPVRCVWRAFRRGRERSDFLEMADRISTPKSADPNAGDQQTRATREASLVRNTKELRLFIAGLERTSAK